MPRVSLPGVGLRGDLPPLPGALPCTGDLPAPGAFGLRALRAGIFAFAIEVCPARAFRAVMLCGVDVQS